MDFVPDWTRKKYKERRADEIDVAERDSRKDEAVVFIFIGATVSLLVWALAKPWITKWIEVGLLILSIDTCANIDHALSGCKGTQIVSANIWRTGR